MSSWRLRVTPMLLASSTLTCELSSFQLKTTAVAKEELDAWREGAHDDLVLAVAVAGRVGEQAMRPFLIWL
jgi:hypothetical protein